MDSVLDTGIVVVIVGVAEGAMGGGDSWIGSSGYLDEMGTE